MVFVVVEDDQIEEILADIATAIGTGKNGDGKMCIRARCTLHNRSKGKSH